MSKELLAKLDEDLKLAGYAKRSRQSYVRAVRQLRNFWSCELEEIEEQQVREYWLHCKDELDWSGATMRISYSGIKFFYQHTLKRDWETLRTLEADRRFVGCTIAGFFGVLHTWGRQLQYHPHVHFVVPGGGLNAAHN